MFDQIAAAALVTVLIAEILSFTRGSLAISTSSFLASGSGSSTPIGTVVVIAMKMQQLILYTLGYRKDASEYRPIFPIGFLIDLAQN